MKKLTRHAIAIFFLLLIVNFVGSQAVADDTCVFGVGSSQVQPNIAILIDNGADMEHIVWNATYCNADPSDSEGGCVVSDYSPNVISANQWDVVDLAASGGGAPPLPTTTTLVLTNVDESSLSFGIGTEVKGVSSHATAIIDSMETVGTDLHLNVLTDLISGTFQVGETVSRKYRGDSATGTLDEIIPPETPTGNTPPLKPNGFFNAKGYGILKGTGNDFYLVRVKSDLTLDSQANGLKATSQTSTEGTWEIHVEIDLNGDGSIVGAELDVLKTITLPAFPSQSVVSETDPDLGDFEIKDNALQFRYAMNYLNWIFGFKPSVGAYDSRTVVLGGHGPLPAQSRFYAAKKAVMAAAKMASNNAKFGTFTFTSSADRGSPNQQSFQFQVDTLGATPKDNVLKVDFVNTINNLGTVAYSPLAEGLATVGGFFDSPASGVLDEEFCQDQFVIVISPGLSSEDQTGFGQDLPTSLSDYDEDDGSVAGVETLAEGELMIDSTKFTIPTNTLGSTWLDDVAHYLFTHDMVGYATGFQKVSTYTVGFMAPTENNAFLINTSNNGNGNTGLYNTADPDYGRYHFPANTPAQLAKAITDAVNDILSQVTTYTAPVVPVTRTVSGDWIYLATFKPLLGNFWKGNLVKFRLAFDAAANTLTILGADGELATAPNGALLDTAVPYWAMESWEDPAYSTSSNPNNCGVPGVAPGTGESTCNYIFNGYSSGWGRNIYTYLGTQTALTHADNAFIPPTNPAVAPDPAIAVLNPLITSTKLGNPAATVGLNNLIMYVRGGDSFDEDKDGETTENRSPMVGDVLHSEPAVVQYNDGTNTESYLFFGANDGMLHAVYDSTVQNISTSSDDVVHFGTEAWAFIPPDQLPRLKLMKEGVGHQYYVDSSPKVIIRGGNGDNVVDSGEQAILICGLRKGGSSYFALDVTDPDSPVFLWRISQSLTDITALGLPAPNVEYPELGETWSVPQFGKVKTSAGDSTGTDVFFIGGGYSTDASGIPDHAKGKAVYAINVETGALVKPFTGLTGMSYSIPSNVQVVTGQPDSSGKIFVDKVYVGDIGGQMWRFGKFTDSALVPLTFPEVDQNITVWNGQIIFEADSGQKFFYPPGITLEVGYDLVHMVTGDRDDPCDQNSSDSVYVVKDDHTASTLKPIDLVDVTIPGPVVSLDGSDNGWYINMSTGEKSLAEVSVFFGVLYFTTFLPNNDPCLPGGEARIYAVNYKTGGEVLSFVDGDPPSRSHIIGGGIPSKPVFIVMEKVIRMVVSVGSTNPDGVSTSEGAGIPVITPLLPPRNFFYLWWREIFG